MSVCILEVVFLKQKLSHIWLTGQYFWKWVKKHTQCMILFGFSITYLPHVLVVNFNKLDKSENKTLILWLMYPTQQQPESKYLKIMTNFSPFIWSFVPIFPITVFSLSLTFNELIRARILALMRNNCCQTECYLQ